MWMIKTEKLLRTTEQYKVEQYCSKTFIFNVQTNITVHNIIHCVLIIYLCEDIRSFLATRIVRSFIISVIVSS